MEIRNDKARQKKMPFGEYEMRYYERSDDIITHLGSRDWDRSFFQRVFSIQLWNLA